MQLWGSVLVGSSCLPLGVYEISQLKSACRRRVKMTQLFAVTPNQLQENLAEAHTYIFAVY
jgi:hypothetical protein